MARVEIQQGAEEEPEELFMEPFRCPQMSIQLWWEQGDCPQTGHKQADKVVTLLLPIWWLSAAGAQVR